MAALAAIVLGFLGGYAAAGQNAGNTANIAMLRQLKSNATRVSGCAVKNDFGWRMAYPRPLRIAAITRGLRRP